VKKGRGVLSVWTLVRLLKEKLRMD
jgi:hypothetical protein